MLSLRGHWSQSSAVLRSDIKLSPWKLAPSSMTSPVPYVKKTSKRLGKKVPSLMKVCTYAASQLVGN